MRNAFADEITTLAAADERVVLLSGDIGNRLFNTYKDTCPDRFLNCGVAEANMTSVAAGMALCGLKPVTYTIAAFNTLRCLEQIRLDVCYQNLPVVIVGVGSGLSYASLNASHHNLEDLACLRAIPNMSIVCPADAWEVRAALRAALGHDGPVYIRMGKKNEPLVHEDVPEFEIGRAQTLQEGADVCLIASGNIVPSVIDAAKGLRDHGLAATVINMHTIKPLDEAILTDVFARFLHVFTVEEHGIAGGLGGGVAEWAAGQADRGARLVRLGTRDAFMYEAGEQDHAREFFGLSVDQIQESILKELQL